MSGEAAVKSVPHVGYLLEQHLEELAFLNVQRRYLLFAPHVPLTGLGEHDERLAAHWDGLVVGEQAAVELAFKRLGEFDPWDVFAAVRVWLELGGPSTEQILEQMTEADPEKLAGWREALRWLPAGALDRLLPVAATREAEAEVRAALVYARSSQNIQDSAALPALVEDESTEARRTLARVLGWGVLAVEPASGLLQKLVDDPEPSVVRAALWSAVLLGNGEAVDHCRELVRAGEADAFQVQTLGLLGRPDDCLLLRPLLEEEPLFPAVARALGYLGSVQAVPWLIDRHTGDQDEDADEMVNAALEILLGELPDLQEEPLGPWWATQQASFPVDRIWLRGRPRPWSLAPEQEPMDSLWLSCLRGKDPQWGWLRREIPDGFFTAGANIEAVPGE